MVNFVYTRAKRDILLGAIDFSTDDIRIILAMTNTTADTEQDVATVSAFTTLDEMDGANYPGTFATRTALATEAVNQDDPNDRAEFDADDVTFSALGAGTRDVQGYLIYKHGTSDADSTPILWVDTMAGLPFTASGTDLVIQWNAEGILQAT